MGHPVKGRFSIDRAPAVAGAAGIAVGGVALLGWVLSISALKSMIPGLPTLKANTALAFILSGGALLAIGRPFAASVAGGRRLLWVFSVAMASVVILLAAATLSQDLFGWRLGIDELLVRDDSATTNPAAPGRMSPMTAVDFALVGVALLLLGGGTSRGGRWAQRAAIAVGVTSLLALIGYAYDIQSLYSIGPYGSMSLPTAGAFLILSAGIFFCDTRTGPAGRFLAPTPGGRVLRGLVPSIIGAPVILGWLRTLGEQAGLYGSQFGIAIFATATILVLSVLVWWTSGALDNVDRTRRRADEQFRMAVEACPNGMVIVDANGRIVLANAETCRMFGWEREHLEGQSLEVLVPVRYRAAHPGQRQQYVANPTTRPMGAGRDLFGVRRDGVEFPVEIALNPLPTPSGAMTLGVIADIAERKRVEESMAAQRKELERSNAELEQFAYVASHDLQEPLRMVSSYTQLLGRRYQGRLDADADDFIGFAVDGANRMQALIDDLLTYSRVGRKEKPLRPVDWEAVFDRTFANLSGAISGSGARVTRGDLPTVVGEEGQLVQLLQNIVGNAIKFRGEDAPTVHVSAVPRDREWEFSVEDNGIGVDPQFSDRIFTIFQRLHARHEYPGSGIGLAICKKIVERHGGRIWVEPRSGGGAAFRFTIQRGTGNE